MSFRYMWNGFVGAVRALFEHDQSQGAGFGVGEMDSGEVELQLNVEGHRGSAYFSRRMWEHIGHLAGWIEISREPTHLRTCGTEYRGCDPNCTYESEWAERFPAEPEASDDER